jgi:hypothetical protein
LQQDCSSTVSRHVPTRGWLHNGVLQNMSRAFDADWRSGAPFVIICTIWGYSCSYGIGAVMVWRSVSATGVACRLWFADGVVVHKIQPQYRSCTYDAGNDALGLVFAAAAQNPRFLLFQSVSHHCMEVVCVDRESSRLAGCVCSHFSRAAPVHEETSNVSWCVRPWCAR